MPGTTIVGAGGDFRVADGGAGAEIRRDQIDFMRLGVQAPWCARLVCVATFSTTENLSGASSCTTVSVPLCPFDANAYSVPGSNALASTPRPIAGVAITFPESAFTTAII